MTSEDWFRTDNTPKLEPITDKQLFALGRNLEQLRDILTPEERVNMELMGPQEFLKGLDKWEASRIIGVLKGDSVAQEIRRRSEGGPKKWFKTGLNG
jgi:hypothetical protein